MYLSETVSEKWKGVMEHADLPEIKDSYKRDVTLRLLENQEKFLNEAAPVNSVGAMADTGGVAKWDPIMISLVRRSMPHLMAYDVCGVQPMSGPTGLIFAMRAKYDGFTGAGAAGEARTAAKLGDSVAGKQVSFKASDGSRSRADFVTKDGVVVETKTGGATLSSGQKSLQND